MLDSLGVGETGTAVMLMCGVASVSGFGVTNKLETKQPIQKQPNFQQKFVTKLPQNHQDTNF